jgi:hypothetical protein
LSDDILGSSLAAGMPFCAMRVLPYLLISPFFAITAVSGQSRTVTKLEVRPAGGIEAILTVIVDTHDTPDLADWGNRAGRRCLEWLPKLGALLPGQDFVPPKKVVLRFDPGYDGVAKTGEHAITISADRVRKHPEDFGLVIHELVHVVQDYRGGGEHWLTEGIADYIRYFIFEPGQRRFPVVPGKTHYREGYGTAGAFLDWIERKRKKGAVAELNAACREGRYRPELFKEIAGASLEDLWRAYAGESAETQ